MGKARSIKSYPKMGIGPSQKTFKSTGSKASSRPVARSNKGAAQRGEVVGAKIIPMKNICSSDEG